jgi:hypothetical protein
MKKLIILIFTCFVAHNTAFSQEKGLPKCISDKGLEFYIEDLGNHNYHYLVRDTNNNIIDTLISFGSIGIPSICLCNDTIATFIFDGYYPMLFSFGLDEKKHWKFHLFYLPPIFPNVGMIRKGKQYEKYRYEYTGPGTIIARLSIMMNLGKEPPKLESVENYIIEYKIDPIQRKLITVKKTLVNE